MRLMTNNKSTRNMNNNFTFLRRWTMLMLAAFLCKNVFAQNDRHHSRQISSSERFDAILSEEEQGLEQQSRLRNNRQLTTKKT